MNLRYDHVLENWDNLDVNEQIEEYCHWGTVAFVELDDIQYTWKMTECVAGETPFLYESHPLRKFYFNWFLQYWDAYEINDWDHETDQDVVDLIKYCPDLAYKLLRGCTVARTRSSSDPVEELSRYWV